MSHITTYVFFDMETTGLPWQERNQTKIIELSLVAALRKDLENTKLGDIPPVSKLTFLLNPKRKIHPEVNKMTGLTNEQLKREPVFKNKINSVMLFLEELQKPVCLVAHNGNTFDYKILLAECIDAGVSLPKDLLCVDSLIGFRKLLDGKDISSKTLELSQNSSLNSQNLMTDDDDEWPEFDISREDWDEIDEICLEVTYSQDITDDEDDEWKENSKSQANKARSEGIKKVFGDNTQKNEVAKKPKKEKTKKESITKKEVKTKVNRTSYKLVDVYKRLLDKEELNAHRAEADCLMLLECVVALKDEFLPWADSACSMLSGIQPLIRY